MDPTKSRSRQPMDLAKAQVPLGQVYVIPERCKECGYCVSYCPEKVLSYSEDINIKGYHYPVVTSGKEDACVHCGFCDLICPELAIYTVAFTKEGTSVNKQINDCEG